MCVVVGCVRGRYLVSVFDMFMCSAFGAHLLCLYFVGGVTLECRRVLCCGFDV